VLSHATRSFALKVAMYSSRTCSTAAFTRGSIACEPCSFAVDCPKADVKKPMSSRKTVAVLFIMIDWCYKKDTA
jgi:hypothetical protein